jgi:catechol 2,3-dioxygenase-like lactoylglutathione lyase family enzyme
MFDHFSLGVIDLEKNLSFYDAALKPLGINRMFEMSDRGIAAYIGADQVSFWLYSKTVEVTNLQSVASPPRFHLAFRAPNRAAVDGFYAAAIAQGGTDEGAPGIRTHYHPNYYAAYVRDLNGYKIEAVCQQPE